MQRLLTKHTVAKQLKKFLRTQKINHFHRMDVIVVSHKNNKNFPPLHFRFNFKSAEVKIFHTIFDDGNNYTVEAHTITQLFYSLIKNELISPIILNKLLHS